MKSKYLPFEIVYEDRDIVVIDKPAGLLTTHTRLHGRAAREAQQTAENMLNAYVRKGQAKSRRQVFLVHRLDRETSGVMMFAKDASLADAIRERWGELTEKTYVADVEGRIEEESGAMESWLKEDDDGYRVRSVGRVDGAKFARTEWRRISLRGGNTRVEVALKTGRKNQIRVHFSEAGHPVVGDVKYGARKADGLHLRAVKLAFTHPFTGRRMVFEVPS